MDENKILLELNDHKNEIGSLKHRMKDVEDKQDEIVKLALSVNELAINMRNMVEVQKQQNDRLTNLEKEPAEAAKYYKRTIITAVITTIVGAVCGALIALII